MNTYSRKLGLLLVILGAIFWGIGGTVSQKLFQQFGISVNWLVTIRLLLAGIALLAIQFFKKERSQILRVWKNKQTSIQLIIFGLLGMLAVQYTYMASISHGNAAVATLLQYLAPVMIIIYTVIRRQAVLTGQDVITVCLALIGSFLLLTNGSISKYRCRPLFGAFYPVWHSPFIHCMPSRLSSNSVPLLSLVGP